MPTEASKQAEAPAEERHASTVNVRMSATMRSELIEESARRHAVDIWLDQCLFVLNEKDFAEFEAALDRPPRPNDEPRALLKKKPLWER
ncbi:hypothetical protein MSC49_03660 [Methylosinus sp. C49]|uniref:type II toxin-antitoxin system TacA family antitoxin n=1 Tax=Methylosinus sp. C49 TaxID=2699395 RepID=UPI001366E928|nr:DUF1778 domain-containing protein [Methylosinus sp. C49]BBU60431.1 hypothetical protein MSC49_03660 [Methylosinus sp. C49]